GDEACELVVRHGVRVYPEAVHAHAVGRPLLGVVSVGAHEERAARDPDHSLGRRPRGFPTRRFGADRVIHGVLQGVRQRHGQPDLAGLRRELSLPMPPTKASTEQSRRVPQPSGPILNAMLMIAANPRSSRRTAAISVSDTGKAISAWISPCSAMRLRSARRSYMNFMWYAIPPISSRMPSVTSAMPKLRRGLTLASTPRSRSFSKSWKIVKPKPIRDNEVRITDISVRSALSRVRWNDMSVRRMDSSVRCVDNRVRCWESWTDAWPGFDSSTAGIGGVWASSNRLGPRGSAAGAPADMCSRPSRI